MPRTEPEAEDIDGELPEETLPADSPEVKVLSNGEFLRDLMRRARYCLIAAPGCEILHKHGWADPAYHDMGIVLCERPYALAILSDRHSGTKEDVALFKRISMAFYRPGGDPAEAVGP